MLKKPECTIFTIRIAKELMEMFEKKCIENFKTRSETIRDFIREYVKEEENA